MLTERFENTLNVRFGQIRMNRSDVDSIVVFRFFGQLIDDRLCLGHVRRTPNLVDQQR